MHAVTLPLYCPRCGQPMTVKVTVPKLIHGNHEEIQARIICPLPFCGGQLNPRLTGIVASVWAGHGAEPVKP